MKIKLKDIKFHGHRRRGSICKITIPMPDHAYTDLKPRKTIYKGGIKKERIVPCCYKYSGDEYPVGSGADNGQIGRVGDVYVYVTSYTFQSRGNCAVSWDLDLLVRDELSQDSCTTTGKLTLKHDCAVCDKAYWL